MNPIPTPIPHKGKAESKSFDLDSVLLAIGKIREAFGAPSISCGVLHENEISFNHGEGLADVEKNLKLDEHTVYNVASCSKAFTTATCGILVDENQLSWTEPVAQYLPGGFHTRHDVEVGKRANLLDLCSHGSGLAPLDHLVCGFHDEFSVEDKEQVHIASNLPVCYDFRSHWLYNNTLIGVVGDIIAHTTGKTSGLVLAERIFQPLGMTRSCTKTADYPADGNFARGYAVLDDGRAMPLELPAIDDGAPQAAAGYVRSSVHDMLIWARAVMEAEEEEDNPSFAEKKNPSTSPGCNNPFRQMQQTRRAYRPMALTLPLPSKTTITTSYGNSYGLGWFRHMLPSSYLGSIGPNFALLPEPPIINQNGPPRLTIAHYGEFNGFLTALYTFPETKSAVVVMANCSPGRGDPADLIAQTLCQELFDMQPRVKLEDFASKAVQTSCLLWPALVEEWVSNRVQNTRHDDLAAYTGSYSNVDYKLTIDISELPETERGREPTPELLSFRINNLERQTARLRHYHFDVWTFLPDSRDDAVKKGMEGFICILLLLLSFLRNEEGSIDGLEWDLQAGVCEGPAPGIEKIVSPISFKRG